MSELKYLMNVIIAWSGTSNTEDYKRNSLRETLSLHHSATCVFLIGFGKAIVLSFCWKTLPEEDSFFIKERKILILNLLKINVDDFEKI